MPLRRLPDDGIVDPVTVDRLIAGTTTPDRATLTEAIEAARRTYGTDGWWVFCADRLRLRSQITRRIADDMEAGAA